MHGSDPKAVAESVDDGSKVFLADRNGRDVQSGVYPPEGITNPAVGH
jgi:hypothetical protein